MRNQHRQIFILVIMITAIALLWMYPGEAMSASKAKEVILSSAPGRGGVEEEACKRFQKYLNELSNGALEVHLYMGGTLGPDEEITAQLRLGEVQVQYAGISELEMFLGPGNWPFSIPFLFEDRAKMQKMLNEVLIPDLNKRLPEADVQLLGAVLRTPRKLTAKKAFLHPEDVKGLKMRIPPISEWLAVWSDILGVNAVALPGSQVFSALQTGMVDAQENPISFVFSNSIYEVAPYIHNTNHMLAPRMIYVSLKWLNTLTEQERAWVFEAGARAFGEQADLELVYEQKLIAELKKKKKVQFVDIDHQEWQAAVVDMVEEKLKSKYSESTWNTYIAPRLQEIRAGKKK